ncbi:MAG TPA: sorbosone dehydrogenase family protein, partial [Casimicrobiaceae bacterium]|nr:sorbosone dehydrogenase family protein [Casimicrobiaceae bacterium]
MITFVVALAPAAAIAQLPLDRIRLPAGFTIEVVARAPGAREMTFGTKGTLFVGSNAGNVYAITLGASGGDANVR